jgi:hypothetical protein
VSIDILNKVIADIEKDIKNLDGKPFNSKVIAEHFGYQGAAIDALARILKSMIEENAKHNHEK